MNSNNNNNKTILTFCNPLLDVTASVNNDFLSKYDLKADDAILASDRHLNLLDDLINTFGNTNDKTKSNTDTKNDIDTMSKSNSSSNGENGKKDILYSAGGAGQNSMRIAQWFLPPNSTLYVGCIGNDENGKTLMKVARKDGLQPFYLIDKTTPTGTCACLLTESGKKRSLVASLNAANNYKIEHLNEIREKLLQATIVYISGYFFTVSIETILEVAKFCKENKKIFCINLSAPFICEYFMDRLEQALPFVDWIFGNETEALTFAQKSQMSLPSDSNNDTTDIIEQVGKRLGGGGKRKVVITQGSKETIVILPQDLVLKFPIDPIAEEEIIDTNGAGDAFVGGFLSQMLLGKELKDCIKTGHYAASVIIRQSGIQVPTCRPQMQ